jgi:hypothetical protein
LSPRRPARPRGSSAVSGRGCAAECAPVDGVEIVDGFGAVEVPWTAIEAFRIVGAAHEVPQVVMERADGEPLRLRPLEGHGWTLNSGRRSMERDVAALNAELARRRR